jgi:antitoxin ParD1/3/4/toxin ParE1/3/4
MPGQGHERKDLTRRPVLFFPLYSYLIVYQPDVDPIRIMAVLRGTRNIKSSVSFGSGLKVRNPRQTSVAFARHFYSPLCCNSFATSPVHPV